MEKGTTNLTTIRNSLKNYEEIEMPYDFKPGENIKYITLDKDTQTEMFYNGGEYVKIGNELINVFVPTTPNPTSGFLLMVPKKNLIFLDITFEQASKFIVSAGTSDID